MNGTRRKDLEPMYLAQHTINWCAIVMKAMNLQVILKRGISCLAERLLAFQELIPPAKTVPLDGAFNG
jgi:hypothetical protein